MILPSTIYLERHFWKKKEPAVEAEEEAKEFDDILNEVAESNSFASRTIITKSFQVGRF